MTGVVDFPAPHQGQRLVWQGAERFTVLCAGRRWFKTTLLEMVSVEQALMGARVLWAGPTYDQVRIAFDGIFRMGKQVSVANKGRMEVRVRGGGLILFRSMDDPDHARGHTADGVVVDEAATVAQEAFYQVLRPMLMTTKGWAWLLGTPKGMNWFWREWQRGAEGAEGYTAFRAPTLGVRIEDGALIREPHPLENPLIPFEELQAVFEQMPERTFRQEILAEFVADAGGVFRGVREVSTMAKDAPRYDSGYVMGIDWGRSEDFTVLSVIDSRTMTQVDVESFSGVGWDIQRGRVRRMADRWRPDIILAESNSIGEPNIEALQAEGLPVRAFATTSKSKESLIGGLSLAIERGKVRLLNDEGQIGQLEAYEMTRLPGGGWRYGAPAGSHDDAVIALALAYEAAGRFGSPLAFANPVDPVLEARLRLFEEEL